MVARWSKRWASAAAQQLKSERDCQQLANHRLHECVKLIPEEFL